MTQEEWDKLPVPIRERLAERGITREMITNIELGAGAFYEPYIKRVDVNFTYDQRRYSG